MRQVSMNTREATLAQAEGPPSAPDQRDSHSNHCGSVNHSGPALAGVVTAQPGCPWLEAKAAMAQADGRIDRRASRASAHRFRNVQAMRWAGDACRKSCQARE